MAIVSKVSRRITPLLALVAGMAIGGSGVMASISTLGEKERVKAELTAKEIGIYADRAHGQLDFYVANASPDYLGWPPVAAEPMPFSKLDGNKHVLQGQTQEKIDTAFKGFTMSGDTAIIYYANHRTRTSKGEPVDQLFENIHVWTREDGRWRLLGGLARKMRG